MKVSVAGSTWGLVAGAPAGLTPTSTDAEKTAAYEALAPYLFPQDCTITALPNEDESWNLSTDPDTICDQGDAIVEQFPTNQTVANSTLGMIMDSTDPLITLIRTLKKNAGIQTATYQKTLPDGVSKTWGEVRVIQCTDDSSNATGRMLFTAGFLYTKIPHRNYQI